MKLRHAAFAIVAGLSTAVAGPAAHADDLIPSTMAIPVTSLGFMMELVARRYALL